MTSPAPTTDRRKRSPLVFFVLVFVLSVPFWIVGATTGLQLTPDLPVSSFIWVCPVIAALSWFLGYFVAGQCEELGGSGYALAHRISRGSGERSSIDLVRFDAVLKARSWGTRRVMVWLLIDPDVGRIQPTTD